MEFYNEVIKNRYLESIANEGTRNVIRYIFLASRSAEEEVLEKDLYNFTVDQIAEVMKNMNFQTANTANANMIHIRSYIRWSIKQGYRDDNINPLSGYDKKWASKFVDRTRKIHYSLDELEDLIADFDNDQDRAMVMCWFEGVGGKQFSELRNLTDNDINWTTNELTLRDENNNERTLIVSDRCVELLEKAKNQPLYKTKGKLGMEEVPLCNSDHIFRNIDISVTQQDEVSYSVIYTRLASIKDYLNLEIFSQNAIRQSGQIYMAYQIFIRDGHFSETKQWHEIGERFKVSTLKSGSKEYPNVSLMKQYITTVNLKELYDIDVEIETRKRTKKPSK